MCDMVGVYRSTDIIRCVVDLICANGVVRVSIGALRCVVQHPEDYLERDDRPAGRFRFRIGSLTLTYLSTTEHSEPDANPRPIPKANVTRQLPLQGFGICCSPTVMAVLLTMRRTQG